MKIINIHTKRKASLTAKAACESATKTHDDNFAKDLLLPTHLVLFALL